MNLVGQYILIVSCKSVRSIITIHQPNTAEVKIFVLIQKGL